MKGTGLVDYSFRDSEIKCLMRILRDKEAELDANLDIFRCFLENYIYNTMTIEEAEAFFNENINKHA